MIFGCKRRFNLQSVNDALNIAEPWVSM